MSVAPGGAAAGRRQFCGGSWGTVDVEGRIVAADVPRSSTPEFVFGKATRLVHPAYPSAAVRERAGGRIVVLAKVSETGAVTSAEVRFGGHPALEQAALDSALGWRFTPTTADGQHVPAYAQLLISFHAP